MYPPNLSLIDIEKSQSPHHRSEKYHPANNSRKGHSADHTSAHRWRTSFTVVFKLMVKRIQAMQRCLWFSWANSGSSQTRSLRYERVLRIPRALGAGMQQTEGLAFPTQMMITVKHMYHQKSHDPPQKISVTSTESSSIRIYCSTRPNIEEAKVIYGSRRGLSLEASATSTVLPCG